MQSPTRYPAWLIAAGNFLFRFRNGVFPVVLLVLIALFPPRYAGGTPAGDWIVDVIGLGIALLGQGLRAAVIGYAYIVRGGKGKQVHADDLVTQGFFNVCRNPLYVGNLLIYAGVLVVHNNPWVYGLAGGFFVFAYIAIVAAEETYLSTRFGDSFARYCERVNRWVPDFARLSEATQGMTFNWGRVVVKDYSTAGAWMLTLLVLAAYKLLALSEPAPPAGSLQLVTAAGVVVIAAIGLARLAKKRRWLTA